jgi:hypothetical protein
MLYDIAQLIFNSCFIHTKHVYKFQELDDSIANSTCLFVDPFKLRIAMVIYAKLDVVNKFEHSFKKEAYEKHLK